MRAIALVIALAACRSQPAPAPTPVTTKPVEPAAYEPSCTDASIGLERNTTDLRAPDVSIADALRAQCGATTGGWPQPAKACFATMKQGGLGDCAKLLSQIQREALLETLGGTDAASIQIALVRLADLKIGIAECDSFIATVSLLLGCEAMSVENRVQLGVETADAWSLPTRGLKPEMQARLSSACKKSLDDLLVQVKPTGCI